jgi:hypothetical protein
VITGRLPGFENSGSHVNRIPSWRIIRLKVSLDFMNSLSDETMKLKMSHDAAPPHSSEKTYEIFGFECAENRSGYVNIFAQYVANSKGAVLPLG